jgi:hypothetical protein
MGGYVMTVREFAAAHGYKIVTEEDAALDRTITGVYACDLLSWAMAKINAGDLWTTVHTNLNIVAVASLTDAACIVIPESIEIEQATITRADRQQIPMLSAPSSAAEIIIKAYNGIQGDCQKA